MVASSVTRVASRMARTRAAGQYPFGRTSLDPPGSVLLEIAATLSPMAAGWTRPLSGSTSLGARHPVRRRPATRPDRATAARQSRWTQRTSDRPAAHRPGRPSRSTAAAARSRPEALVVRVNGGPPQSTSPAKGRRSSAAAGREREVHEPLLVRDVRSRRPRRRPGIWGVSGSRGPGAGGSWR